MEKPINLKLQDFKNNAVSLVNTSGLPLFAIEPILKDLLSAVQVKMEQEYLRDKAIYEQSLNEEKTTEEEEQHD